MRLKKMFTTIILASLPSAICFAQNNHQKLWCPSIITLGGNHQTYLANGRSEFDPNNNNQAYRFHVKLNGYIQYDHYGRETLSLKKSPTAKTCLTNSKDCTVALNWLRLDDLSDITGPTINGNSCLYKVMDGGVTLTLELQHLD